MNFDLDSIMSDTDKKALNLANTQLFALLILLIGSLTLIKSSSQNRELILRKYMDFDTPAPSPIKTAIYGTKINLSAILLLLYVVVIRQNDTDLAYSSRLIKDTLYNPSTTLSKVSLITFIITLVTLSSLKQIASAQVPNEPVEEEEFIF